MVAMWVSLSLFGEHPFHMILLMFRHVSLHVDAHNGLDCNRAKLKIGQGLVSFSMRVKRRKQ